jgi:hypothetical protein
MRIGTVTAERADLLGDRAAPCCSRVTKCRSNRKCRLARWSETAAQGDQREECTPLKSLERALIIVAKGARHLPLRAQKLLQLSWK